MFCLIVCVFVFLNCNISQPTNSRPINSILRDIVQSISGTASRIQHSCWTKKSFHDISRVWTIFLILFGSSRVWTRLAHGLIVYIWFRRISRDLIVFHLPGEHVPSGDGDRLQVLVHHVQLWSDEMDHWHSEWRQQFRVGRDTCSGKQFRVGRDTCSGKQFRVGWDSCSGKQFRVGRDFLRR